MKTPTDKNEVWMEVTSGPTKEGYYGFTFIWWAEGFHTGPCWRGQVFLSNDPVAHKKKFETSGRKVIVKDYRLNRQEKLPI